MRNGVVEREFLVGTGKKMDSRDVLEMKGTNRLCWFLIFVSFCRLGLRQPVLLTISKSVKDRNLMILGSVYVHTNLSLTDHCLLSFLRGLLI
jgi:hypothetical protein